MIKHKKNEIHQLKIESIGTNGEGVARLDGQVVFIPGAITGEICEIQLLKVGKSSAWGKVNKIITPSPDRENPDCPHYPKCGGCQFRHMSYKQELESKRQRAEDALQRIGGSEITVAEILGAENTTRYRNKVQLPVSGTAEEPKIGYYRARSHDVVDVEDCLLQPQWATALCRAVREWMKAHKTEPYREETHTGLIRHVFLRFAGEGALCCVVANGDKFPAESALTEALCAAVPALKGVVLSTNTDQTNVILGREMRTLWGRDWLDDTLCGLTFRISVPSFYQVNRDQAEVLYKKALEFAALTGKETVLDLYCGIGTISLVMAGKAGRVYGAEAVPAAVEDARENAKRNGIKNTEFLCGDAGEAARQLADQGVRPDVICVDPPRKGLSPEVVETVASMNPRRVVYVSCDPATLARDVKRFAELGYVPAKAVAVDLFPRTAHIEVVIQMTYCGDKKK